MSTFSTTSSGMKLGANKTIQVTTDQKDVFTDIDTRTGVVSFYYANGSRPAIVTGEVESR